eukprot:2835047-Pyramimonas_sp.AAC.2
MSSQHQPPRPPTTEACPIDGPIGRGERAYTHRVDQSDEGRGHIPSDQLHREDRGPKRAYCAPLSLLRLSQSARRRRWCGLHPPAR